MFHLSDKKCKLEWKLAAIPTPLLPTWNLDVMSGTEVATLSPWSNKHSNEKQYAY